MRIETPYWFALRIFFIIDYLLSVDFLVHNSIVEMRYLLMIISNLCKNLRRNQQLLVLFFLPLLFLIVSLRIRQQHGPYWLGNNSDPEYAYLLNFLNITQLKIPGHTDHPGTPLQVLGGIIIQITCIIQSLTYSVNAHTVESVLKNPEFYLVTVNNVLLILTTACLLILGLTAFFLSQSLTLSLLLQLAPFSWTPLILSVRVSPEPLLFCLTQILVILLLFYIYSEIERSPRFAVAIGVIFGLGVATKVTFFPLGLVILLLPGLRQKGLAVMAAIITFILATLPIITQYNRVFEWLTSIATHTGGYGQGNLGLIDFSAIPSAFSGLLEKDKFFFYLIGLSALNLFIITVYLIWYQFKNNNSQNRFNLLATRKFYYLFTCLLLIILVQLLITLKHPGIHYLLPSMGLSSLLTFVQIILVEKILTPVLKRMIVRNIGLFAFGVYFVALFANTYEQIVLIERFNKSYLLEIQTIQHLIQNKYNNCAHVRYYRSSDQEYALKFGNDFAANQYALSLQSIYPNGGIFYNLWSQKYYSFNKELDSKYLTNKICIVFQGSPLKNDVVYVKFRQDIKMEPVFEGNNESLYLFIKNHQ